MCMEDYRLGRKLKTKTYNLTTNTTIPADARRVALIMVPTNQPDTGRNFSLNVTDQTAGGSSAACIGRLTTFYQLVYLDIKQVGQLLVGPLQWVNETGAGGATITEIYLEDV